MFGWQMGMVSSYRGQAGLLVVHLCIHMKSSLIRLELGWAASESHVTLIFKTMSLEMTAKGIAWNSRRNEFVRFTNMALTK